MQDPNRTYPFGSTPSVPPLWYLPQVPARGRPLLPASGGMEIGGLLNARHVAAAADAQMRQHFQHPMQMNHRSYSMGQTQQQPMNPHQQQQHHQMQHPNGMNYPPMQPSQTHPQMYAESYGTREDSQEQMADDDFGASRPKGEGAQKQFNCSTCPKAFARRSDLARHGKPSLLNDGSKLLTRPERIHSGVRPHACEHPGCGKRFIQRSALTVHQRVHTGVKPHMCERCSKVLGMLRITTSRS